MRFREEEWAGESVGEYREYYGVPLEGRDEEAQWLGLLHYPSYYNSTVTRLYNGSSSPETVIAASLL